MKIRLLEALFVLALLPVARAGPAHGAFPGTNGKIAFTRNVAYPGFGVSNVFLMNADGSGQTNVSNVPVTDFGPMWSPNGTQIVFTRVDSNNFGEIYVMNADGTGQTNLTNSPVAETDPAWSPDGTDIAFRSWSAVWSIYLMDADGSGVTQLTNRAPPLPPTAQQTPTPSNIPGNDYGPAWSPDGTLIAFSKDPGTVSGGIYVVDESGGETRLTSGIDQDPAWSPDGTKIAFTGFRDSASGDVYVINADGSGVARLTNGIGGDSPAWSPDGTKIAFGTNVIGSPSTINVMNADGSNQTPIAPGYAPDWQPLVDSDGDGVYDPSDNCRTVSNPLGQTADVDGDLAGDACDGPGSGNMDCSGPVSGVSAIDALKLLRFSASLSVSQSEPCLNIGLPRLLPPPDNWKVGDVDCSGLVNSVDALKILRAVASLTVSIPAGCPAVKPA